MSVLDDYLVIAPGLYTKVAAAEAFGSFLDCIRLDDQLLSMESLTVIPGILILVFSASTVIIVAREVIQLLKPRPRVAIALREVLLPACVRALLLPVALDVRLLEFYEVRGVLVELHRARGTQGLIQVSEGDRRLVAGRGLLRRASVSPDQANQGEVCAVLVTACTATDEPLVLFLRHLGSIVAVLCRGIVLLLLDLIAIELLDQEVADVLPLTVEELTINWRAGACLSHRHREGILNQATGVWRAFLSFRCHVRLLVFPLAEAFLTRRSSYLWLWLRGSAIVIIIRPQAYPQVPLFGASSGALLKIPVSSALVVLVHLVERRLLATVAAELLMLLLLTRILDSLQVAEVAAARLR